MVSGIDVAFLMQSKLRRACPGWRRTSKLINRENVRSPRFSPAAGTHSTDEALACVYTSYCDGVLGRFISASGRDPLLRNAGAATSLGTTTTTFSVVVSIYGNWAF